MVFITLPKEASKIRTRNQIISNYSIETIRKVGYQYLFGKPEDEMARKAGGIILSDSPQANPLWDYVSPLPRNYLNDYQKIVGNYSGKVDDPKFGKELLAFADRLPVEYADVKKVVRQAISAFKDIRGIPSSAIQLYHEGAKATIPAFG